MTTEWRAEFDRLRKVGDDLLPKVLDYDPYAIQEFRMVLRQMEAMTRGPLTPTAEDAE